MNIINDDLRISMNERTYFFITIYLSHFILERVGVSVVCERDGWRDIYSERRLLPISSSRSQGVPTLAPPCKLVRDDLIGSVSLARLRFSALYQILTAWLSLSPLPVTHLFVQSALTRCLLIKI